MRNHFFTLFLLSLVTCGIAAEQPVRPISLDYLLSAELVSTSPVHSLRLRFLKESKYVATYASEGVYWHNEGRFEIVGNEIILTPSVCKAYPESEPMPCNQTLDKARCSLIELPNDVEFLEGIQCTSQTNRFVLVHDKKENPTAFFPNSRKKVPGGVSRSIKGVGIVTVNRQGITTDDVKVRAEPNLTAQSYDYLPQLFSNAKPLPFVPKGTTIFVIARTTQKASVQRWNNYWYLVNAGVADQVWMYGEFIEFK